MRSDALGAGYAQLVNVALSDDFSSARYEVDGGPGVTDAPLQVARFPFQLVSRDLAGGSFDLLLELAYLRFSADFTVGSPAQGSGRLASRWQAYGGTVGGRFRYPLATWLSLRPSLRLGAVQLDNDADYFGVAETLRPALDGVVFNWDTRASVATADLALVATRQWGVVDARTTARVARSRMESFDESDAAVGFRESANTLSLRLDLEGPTGRSLAGHAASWTALAGYSRFFGENADALGFNDVIEAGAGLALAPKQAGSPWGKVAFSASVLRGSGVDGWSVGFGLRD